MSQNLQTQKLNIGRQRTRTETPRTKTLGPQDLDLWTPRSGPVNLNDYVCGHQGPFLQTPRRRTWDPIDKAFGPKSWTQMTRPWTPMARPVESRNQKSKPQGVDLQTFQDLRTTTTGPVDLKDQNCRPHGSKLQTPRTRTADYMDRNCRPQRPNLGTARTGPLTPRIGP